VSNVPGEVGKVATSAIDALRGNPGLLVLVLLQLVTMGILAWVQMSNNAYRHERELLLLRSCLPYLDGKHDSDKHDRL
jgi:hypothetical protein